MADQAMNFPAVYFTTSSRDGQGTSSSSNNSPSSSSNPPKKTHQEKLLELQAQSFGRDELADCEIHVMEKVFKVNRYFLCLHSEVFSAYLNSDSIENSTKTIKINDLDPVFVEAMLRFMYSGKVENLKEIAHDLYVVSDRYNVKILQDICLEYMFNNLDLKHIFNCLELAFQLDIEDLKQKSIEFAVKNKLAIQENDEWEPLIQRCPQISITFMKVLTKESEELRKRVQELESQLEGQKCPHHHCRIPNHEILLRHERHLQQVRENRRRNQNEDPQRPQFRRDRFDEMMNRLRRERERRGLPPLEQLRGQERARIMHEALNRYQLMGFDNSDDEEFFGGDGEMRGQAYHENWANRAARLREIRAANENQQNARNGQPQRPVQQRPHHPPEHNNWRGQIPRPNNDENEPYMPRRYGQRFAQARRQPEPAPEVFEPEQPGLQVIELDESDNEGGAEMAVEAQPIPEPPMEAPEPENADHDMLVEAIAVPPPAVDLRPVPVRNPLVIRRVVDSDSDDSSEN